MAGFRFDRMETVLELDRLGGKCDNISEKAKNDFKLLFLDDWKKDTSGIKEQKQEYDADGTRKLTTEEKQNLRDKLGWSEEKIEKKCRIDEDGVIHFKCRMEKDNHSGVEYVEKTVEINGVKIKVTVPEFNSTYDTELSKENYQKSNSKQFAECNKNLKEAVEKDPKLREKFTDEQLEDIKNGDTPRGYTWHHNEEPGRMQLVKTEDHDQCIGGAPHTGGNSLWGNKASDKKQEGVQF